MGILAVLVAILVPAISQARHHARQAACAANLHQVGAAIHAYAMDNLDCMPFGPSGADAPLFSPVNLYPRWGVVTSLISDSNPDTAFNGAPVGLGMMIRTYLSSNPRVLFCPDVDQSSIADAELSLFGKGQAQCDYYYRHAGWTNIFANGDPRSFRLRLSNLGTNSQGRPIRAVAIDVNFVTLSGLAAFGAYTRTCHAGANVNCLYSDGHVAALDNRDGAYTVTATVNLDQSLSYILKVFENADR